MQDLSDAAENVPRPAFNHGFHRPAAEASLRLWCANHALVMAASRISHLRKAAMAELSGRECKRVSQ